MADRVEIAFRRAAVRLIPDDASVLAAVSGGADSVALLHLLARHAARRPVRLIVAHLDHGLRRGSAADRRWVEALAAELEIGCLSERRCVPDLRRRGESPEEASRRVRREFLIETAKRTGAGLVATGHTLDDQAETILMRLVRGAGPSALTGMADAGPGPFVRPLLGIERRDVRAWLERRGIDFREDPTNRNLRYDRNLVRLRLLPLIAEALNPKAARHLVDGAARLREDAAFLDQMARASYVLLRKRRRRGGLELHAPSLAEAPLPLARRIARTALEEAGADPRRIGSAHVQALLDLARGGSGRKADLPGRLVGRKRGDALTLGGRRVW